MKKAVAIIGGGISGLAGAYFLHKQARQAGLELEVHLFERSKTLGGVIRSEQVGGFLLEAGPEAFVSYKPSALKLAGELGLSGDIIGSNDRLRQTFVVWQGKLWTLPEGMAFLSPVSIGSFWKTPLLSTAGKLRALLEPLIPASRGEVTVRSFLERRMGRELTERVGEPLVSAIYGGNIDRLSVASALPDTYGLEQKYGSLWKGLRQKTRMPSGSHPKSSLFLTLRKGMAQMVQRLEEALDSVHVHREVHGLRLSSANGAYRIIAPGANACFDGVILATPSYASAEILRTVSPEAAGILRQIPYSTTYVVYLAYKRSEFSHPLDGFGFVTPAREARVMDACTWTSSKFDHRCPAEYVLLRCAIHDGRMKRDEISRERMLEQAHGEIQRLLGVSCAPVFSQIYKASNAMPQMMVGHGRRLQQLNAILRENSGISVCSAFYGGVGIPDCISNAETTAHELIGHLFKRRGRGTAPSNVDESMAEPPY